jgi:serine/threonine protein kinase
LKELQEPLLGVKWSTTDPRQRNEDLFNTPPRELFMELLGHSEPNDPTPCVVTELAQYSLQEYIEDNPVLSMQEIKGISRSLVMAVAGLHAKSWVHLDIKPENIMYFGSSWKVIDVEGCIHAGKGFATGSGSTVAISATYASPELAKTLAACQYFLNPNVRTVVSVSCGMDVWSTGMTIAKIVSGKSPCKHLHNGFIAKGASVQSASNQLMQWLAEQMRAPKLQLRLDTRGDQQLEDLLYSWLLVPNPSGRKELAESLSHDFLTSAPTTPALDVEVEVATTSRGGYAMSDPSSPGPGFRAPCSPLPSPAQPGRSVFRHAQTRQGTEDEWLKEEMRYLPGGYAKPFAVS